MLWARDGILCQYKMPPEPEGLLLPYACWEKCTAWLSNNVQSGLQNGQTVANPATNLHLAFRKAYQATCMHLNEIQVSVSSSVLAAAKA